MFQSTQEFPLSRKAGLPVAFDGCAGFLHPARSNTGVLMIPPWGFEEFTVRAAWRTLAEQLAEHHFSCLRFDLPGTGDSIGAGADIVDLATWRHAVRAAAAELRGRTGIRHLVVLGQGLGGLLAEDLADDLEAEALVLLAPSPEGRAGMRELELWGAMVAAALRIPVEKAEGEGLNIGGFTLSNAMVDQFKAFRVTTNPVTHLKVALALTRETRPADAMRVAALEARGVAVTVQDFDDHAAYVAHLATPEVPTAAFRCVTGWLVDMFPARREAATRLRLDTAAALAVAGDAIHEEAIIFGNEERLFGVLCRPEAARALVIIPNSGYNPHVGWARSNVTLARRLAEAGIATFRMDCASMGDSDVLVPEVRDVLYSPGQIDDVIAAIDALEPRGLGPIIVAGRCSGAYIALHAAERDHRIAGVVSINALRLIWHPRETLEEAMRTGSSSLADYRKRAFSREFVRRMMRRELPISDLAGKLMAKLQKKLLTKLACKAGRLTVRGSLLYRLRQRFAAFEARGVRTALVYAEGDGGLDELALYFAAKGRRLEAYPGIECTFVPGADHNMTSSRAQAAIYEAVVRTVERIRA